MKNNSKKKKHLLKNRIFAGQNIQQIVVQNYFGDSQTMAEMKIARAGLTVGTIN